MQVSFMILLESFMILQETCNNCYFLHNCTIFLTKNFNDFLAGVTAPLDLKFYYNFVKQCPMYLMHIDYF